MKDKMFRQKMFTLLLTMYYDVNFSLAIYFIKEHCFAIVVVGIW